MKCPDRAECHHGCLHDGNTPMPCWRVANAEPLSDVFEDDKWPVKMRVIHAAPHTYRAVTPEMVFEAIDVQGGHRDNAFDAPYVGDLSDGNFIKLDGYFDLREMANKLNDLISDQAEQVRKSEEEPWHDTEGPTADSGTTSSSSSDSVTTLTAIDRKEYARTVGVHIAHCYHGEDEGCKYGDDDCPAKPKQRVREMISFGVVPGNPSLSVCSRCSAAVMGQAAHIQWHRNVQGKG